MSFDLYAKLTFAMLVINMLLPVILVIRLGRIRFTYLDKQKKSGKTEGLLRLAVSDAGWPDKILQIQNAYKNQFELPVIFYALTILTLTLHLTDLIMVLLCIAFVLVRYAHALVHITTNRIPHRLNLFTASLAIVVAQLLYLSVKILGA